MKLVAAKCPSCGANIKVDRSLKFTKCEYCDTEIMVEEAVENLLKVELKDSPTLDNYLKLGNRYFENQEFEEAYKIYSKAEEIDPDNPIVVLRRGLCRTLITDYNVLDINSSINGMKTAYSLMKKMKISRDEINNCINDTGTTLYITKKYIVDVYNHNKLNKEQTKGYIERLEACLEGYVYLDSIAEGDKALENRIVSSIIEIIDITNDNGVYIFSIEHVNLAGGKYFISLQMNIILDKDNADTNGEMSDALWHIIDFTISKDNLLSAGITAMNNQWDTIEER